MDNLFQKKLSPMTFQVQNLIKKQTVLQQSLEAKQQSLGVVDNNLEQIQKIKEYLFQYKNTIDKENQYFKEKEDNKEKIAKTEEHLKKIESYFNNFDIDNIQKSKEIIEQIDICESNQKELVTDLNKEKEIELIQAIEKSFNDIKQSIQPSDDPFEKDYSILQYNVLNQIKNWDEVKGYDYTQYSSIIKNQDISYLKTDPTIQVLQKINFLNSEERKDIYPNNKIIKNKLYQYLKNTMFSNQEDKDLIINPKISIDSYIKIQDKNVFESLGIDKEPFIQFGKIRNGILAQSKTDNYFLTVNKFYFEIETRTPQNEYVKHEFVFDLVKDRKEFYQDKTHTGDYVLTLKGLFDKLMLGGSVTNLRFTGIEANISREYTKPSTKFKKFYLNKEKIDAFLGSDQFTTEEKQRVINKYSHVFFQKANVDIDTFIKSKPLSYNKKIKINDFISTAIGSNKDEPNFLKFRVRIYKLFNMYEPQTENKQFQGPKVLFKNSDVFLKPVLPKEQKNVETTVTRLYEFSLNEKLAELARHKIFNYTSEPNLGQSIQFDIETTSSGKIAEIGLAITNPSTKNVQKISILNSNITDFELQQTKSFKELGQYYTIADIISRLKAKQSSSTKSIIKEIYEGNHVVYLQDLESQDFFGEITNDLLQNHSINVDQTQYFIGYNVESFDIPHLKQKIKDTNFKNLFFSQKPIYDLYRNGYIKVALAQKGIFANNNSQEAVQSYLDISTNIQHVGQYDAETTATINKELGITSQLNTTFNKLINHFRAIYTKKIKTEERDINGNQTEIIVIGDENNTFLTNHKITNGLSQITPEYNKFKIGTAIDSLIVFDGKSFVKTSLDDNIIEVSPKDEKNNKFIFKINKNLNISIPNTPIENTPIPSTSTPSTSVFNVAKDEKMLTIAKKITQAFDEPEEIKSNILLNDQIDQATKQFAYHFDIWEHKPKIEKTLYNKLKNNNNYISDLNKYVTVEYRNLYADYKPPIFYRTSAVENYYETFDFYKYRYKVLPKKTKNEIELKRTVEFIEADIREDQTNKNIITNFAKEVVGIAEENNKTIKEIIEEKIIELEENTKPKIVKTQLHSKSKSEPTDFTFVEEYQKLLIIKEFIEDTEEEVYKEQEYMKNGLSQETNIIWDKQDIIEKELIKPTKYNKFYKKFKELIYKQSTDDDEGEELQVTKEIQFGEDIRRQKIESTTIKPNYEELQKLYFDYKMQIEPDLFDNGTKFENALKEFNTIVNNINAVIGPILEDKYQNDNLSNKKLSKLQQKIISSQYETFLANQKFNPLNFESDAFAESFQQHFIKIITQISNNKLIFSETISKIDFANLNINYFTKSQKLLSFIRNIIANPAAIEWNENINEQVKQKNINFLEIIKKTGIKSIEEFEDLQKVVFDIQKESEYNFTQYDFDNLPSFFLMDKMFNITQSSQIDGNIIDKVNAFNQFGALFQQAKTGKKKLIQKIDSNGKVHFTKKTNDLFLLLTETHENIIGSIQNEIKGNTYNMEKVVKSAFKEEKDFDQQFYDFIINRNTFDNEEVVSLDSPAFKNDEMTDDVLSGYVQSPDDDPEIQDSPVFKNYKMTDYDLSYDVQSPNDDPEIHAFKNLNKTSLKKYKKTAKKIRYLLHDSNELNTIKSILDAAEISDKQLNQIINGGIQTNPVTTSQTLPISTVVQKFASSSNNTNITNTAQTNKVVQTQVNNTIINIGPQVKSNTISNQVSNVQQSQQKVINAVVPVTNVPNVTNNQIQQKQKVDQTVDNLSQSKPIVQDINIQQNQVDQKQKVDQTVDNLSQSKPIVQDINIQQNQGKQNQEVVNTIQNPPVQSNSNIKKLEGWPRYQGKFGQILYARSERKMDVQLRNILQQSQCEDSEIDDFKNLAKQLNDFMNSTKELKEKQKIQNIPVVSIRPKPDKSTVLGTYLDSFKKMRKELKEKYKIWYTPLVVSIQTNSNTSISTNTTQPIQSKNTNSNASISTKTTQQIQQNTPQSKPIVVDVEQNSQANTTNIFSLNDETQKIISVISDVQNNSSIQQQTNTVPQNITSNQKIDYKKRFTRTIDATQKILQKINDYNKALQTYAITQKTKNNKPTKISIYKKTYKNITSNEMQQQIVENYKIEEITKQQFKNTYLKGYKDEAKEFLENVGIYKQLLFFTKLYDIETRASCDGNLVITPVKSILTENIVNFQKIYFDKLLPQQWIKENIDNFSKLKKITRTRKGKKYTFYRDNTKNTNYKSIASYIQKNKENIFNVQFQMLNYIMTGKTKAHPDNINKTKKISDLIIENNFIIKANIKEGFDELTNDETSLLNGNIENFIGQLVNKNYSPKNKSVLNAANADEAGKAFNEQLKLMKDIYNVADIFFNKPQNQQINYNSDKFIKEAIVNQYVMLARNIQLKTKMSKEQETDLYYNLQDYFINKNSLNIFTNIATKITPIKKIKSIYQQKPTPNYKYFDYYFYNYLEFKIAQIIDKTRIEEIKQNIQSIKSTQVQKTAQITNAPSTSAASVSNTTIPAQDNVQTISNIFNEAPTTKELENVLAKKNIQINTLHEIYSKTSENYIILDGKEYQIDTNFKNVWFTDNKNKENNKNKEKLNFDINEQIKIGQKSYDTVIYDGYIALIDNQTKEIFKPQHTFGEIQIEGESYRIIEDNDAIRYLVDKTGNRYLYQVQDENGTNKFIIKNINLKQQTKKIKLEEDYVSNFYQKQLIEFQRLYQNPQEQKFMMSLLYSYLSIYKSNKEQMEQIKVNKDKINKIINTQLKTDARDYIGEINDFIAKLRKNNSIFFKGRVFKLYGQENQVQELIKDSYNPQIHNVLYTKEIKIKNKEVIVINKLGNVINGEVSVNININNAFKSKSVNKNEIELKDSIIQLMEDISENNDEDVLTNAVQKFYDAVDEDSKIDTTTISEFVNILQKEYPNSEIITQYTKIADNKYLEQLIAFEQIEQHLYLENKEHNLFSIKDLQISFFKLYDNQKIDQENIRTVLQKKIKENFDLADEMSLYVTDIILKRSIFDRIKMNIINNISLEENIAQPISFKEDIVPKKYTKEQQYYGNKAFDEILSPPKNKQLEKTDVSADEIINSAEEFFKVTDKKAKTNFKKYQIFGAIQAGIQQTIGIGVNQKIRQEQKQQSLYQTNTALKYNPSLDQRLEQPDFGMTLFSEDYANNIVSTVIQSHGNNFVQDNVVVNLYNNRITRLNQKDGETYEQ